MTPEEEKEARNLGKELGEDVDKADKFLNKALDQLSQEMTNQMAKMPADKLKLHIWIDDWLKEQEEELLRQGLDIFQILGMLDMLKGKIIRTHLNTHESLEKMHKMIRDKNKKEKDDTDSSTDSGL